MRGMKGLHTRAEADERYQEYLRRIDVEAVLDYYRAEHVSRNGDEIIHSCLIDNVDPHHSNGDANPSASANVERKKYICRSYGGGDIFWLIMKMEGKESFHQIVPVIGEFLSGATVESTEDFVSEIERYLGSAEAVVPPPVYNERVLRPWALYHPYLRERGVTKEAAERLQLGYDEREVRITIPHFFGGQLLGWQKRALEDDRWPKTPHPRTDRPLNKYESSTGMPKSTTLYNYDRVRERGLRKVIVVESALSVAKAESLMTGDDDVLAGVVCTFGAKPSDRQIDLLAGFDEVTVHTDSDPAGRRGAMLLIRALYRLTAVFHVEPEPGKDMGDYDSRDDLVALLSTREPAVLALPRLEKAYGGRQRSRK